MPTEDRIRFTFVSQAQSEDTFTVARFQGCEGISQLYSFEIMMYSDDADLDLKQILKNPAKLTIEREGETVRFFHGILSTFEQLHEVSGKAYYRAVLVPRLWLADQYHENQLFLDKKFPEILEEILKQAGLTSNDYELKLTGSYPPWEYVCQYNETDYNFLARWMEREGIYYYFEQGDQSEKLIVTDSTTAHQDIPGGQSIRYSPPDSLTPTATEQVRQFTCHQQMLPTKVILKDYNYRKPSLDLKGEAQVDGEGRGTVYIYGEHFKTPEEGNALAKIRAEELLCREATFHGEGTVHAFLSGYIFEMHDHYRDSYNQRYLITELRHEGVQSTYLSGAGSTGSGGDRPAYVNNFAAIPADIQFRPLRLAAKPRVDGTLNARVDAAGSGQYAEIDDEGRYKVRLPFDQSDSGDGKASRWVRMAQPYAGADYGMHFPLHKGTEVLLTFIDGDPDRPIIAGTVPNPETGSPVKSGNQTQCMIRTGGGNQIKIEDSGGGEQICMSSPHSGSVFSIGAPRNPSAGISGTTLGDLTWRAFGNLFTEIDVDERHVIHGIKEELVVGDSIKQVQGSAREKIVGNRNVVRLATDTEFILGAKISNVVGLKVDTLFGGLIKRSPTSSIELNANVKKKEALKSEAVGKLKGVYATVDQKISTLKQVGVSVDRKIQREVVDCSGRYRVDGGFVTLYGKGGALELNADALLKGGTVNIKGKGGGALELNANATLKGGTVNIKGTVKVNGTALKVSR
ncbi:MAG: hypothetical protein BWK76_01245 [Desulfobulbaceae bacterium A2]|nr:MAG: hypothetical protein BWK76_01245 [Desulfobulbaceae bacterium A2]